MVDETQHALDLYSLYFFSSLSVSLCLSVSAPPPPQQLMWCFDIELIFCLGLFASDCM